MGSDHPQSLAEHVQDINVWSMHSGHATQQKTACLIDVLLPFPVKVFTLPESLRPPGKVRVDGNVHLSGGGHLLDVIDGISQVSRIATTCRDGLDFWWCVDELRHHR